MDQVFTSEQVAERYGMTVRGVEGWRYHGKGPRWFMAGKRAMYREADILAWEKEDSEERAKLRKTA